MKSIIRKLSFLWYKENIAVNLPFCVCWYLSMTLKVLVKRVESFKLTADLHLTTCLAMADGIIVTVTEEMP